MPTNRTRQTRARIGAEGLSSDAYIYFKWSGTISSWGTGLTKENILSFWKKHRAAIMARYLEEKRLKNDRDGKRPSFYFDELESKHPRRKTGTTKWIGPMRSDAGDRTIVDDVYETDHQYLKRLGLLEPWEKDLKIDEQQIVEFEENEK